MKLSEAILAGSDKRPATESGWFALNQDGQWTTCAIAAAMEAFGLVVFDGGAKNFPGCTLGVPGIDRLTGKPDNNCILPPPWFDALVNVWAGYPCPCGGEGTLFKIIQHLHDVHRWSREATALWVGTLEEKGVGEPVSVGGVYPEIVAL